MPYALLGLITIALWIYCLVDLITSDESQVRNLPKLVWLFVVVLLPTIGSILWLVAGRPLDGRPLTGRLASNTSFGEYDRPGRAVAGDPAADEEFLRRCRERAEQQRREAKRQRGEG